MTHNKKVRKLEVADIPEALRLVWETFLEFEAPDYSEEGVKEFKSYIEPSSIIDKLSKSELFLWGYFDESRLLGVIATKPPCHISLLFVNKNFHLKGIARALYNEVSDYYKKNSEYSVMTVNSSPYAAEAYRRLGFVDTDAEQVVNGIRFVPMKHAFR